ncbi:MAG TPA: DNA primase [Candidatus Tumulicola sp.]|nr:DNA primase [Candidatus Tumulicola sp.]
MRFDQGAIAEIHARIDIGNLIGTYVPLKKRGNDLVGLCPFHAEKTPSFHVHPDRGFFKCFGCGAGGDAIAFVQRVENVPFADAVRALAAKAGVELEPENPAAARARSGREAIYEANRIAAGFFARTLAGDAGRRARDYCDRRGLNAETLARFTIGYAPDSWDALTDELRREGVEAEVAVKAGLLKTGQRGCYDFYRDRLMVPTYATTGEVIAFGGRALGEAEPKYLNTSTTPVYVKGRHLFALNVARRAAQTDRTAIVVEGYLDCIALHQAGFGNAVASLGTSFTAEQATELRKYADYVYLCFDGDPAGSAAATKAVDVASKAIEHTGSSVRVVLMPPGEDPDSFVRGQGAGAFKALLEAAKPAIEFRIDTEIERLRAGFDNPAKVAPRAEAMIREMAPREEWDRWRVYVAGRLQVSPDDLRNSRFLANSANFAPRSAVGSFPGSRHARAAAEPSSYEREVLGILLEEPALVLEYGASIEATQFRDDALRRIYERIVQASGTLRATADVFALFAEDQAGLDALAALGARDRSSAVRYGGTAERRAHLDRVVDRLARDAAQQRYRELSERIDDELTAGRSVPEDVLREYEALVLKLKR